MDEVKLDIKDIINEAQVDYNLEKRNKIKEGVIDRSYGIHVAEMLKFPEEVL